MPLNTTPLNPAAGGANIVTDLQPIGTVPVSELAVSPDGISPPGLVSGLAPYPVGDGTAAEILRDISESLEELVDALTDNLEIEDTIVRSAVASGPTQVSVGTVAGLVMQPNHHRKECVIINTGVTPIYLGFGTVLPTAVNGLPLSPCSNYAGDGTGGSFISDIWKGAIYAISTTSAGVVTQMEML